MKFGMREALPLNYRTEERYRPGWCDTIQIVRKPDLIVG